MNIYLLLYKGKTSGTLLDPDTDAMQEDHFLFCLSLWSPNPNVVWKPITYEWDVTELV